MKKTVAVILIILMISIVFSACGSTGDSTGGPTGGLIGGLTGGSVLNPNRLSADEQLIFDSFKGSITRFYNPTSVRILGVSDIQLPGEDGEFCFVKVSAQNRMGGNTSEVYMLVLNGDLEGQMVTKEDLYGYGEFTYTDSKTISISKLNNAIKEYLDELGLT